ncbi:MAG: M3 family metallopeptidase, partial [Bacteroidota bacterium]
FKRVSEVYEAKDALELNKEQAKLLEETYKNFSRSGANLIEADKENLREINQKLSVLTLQFGENVLSETNEYKLVIEDEADLAGLPESVIASAAEAAKSTGDDGKWVFTLHNPSMIPFLQFADNRDLREEIYKAYLYRGNKDNENDNKAIIAEIVNLRVKRAKLLGYETHAHYVLADNMAQNPDNVYSLLNELWEKSLPMTKKEAASLQQMISNSGEDFKLESWDWWYYAEKLRKEKYDLDEKTLRPYFKLENVREGVFTVINNLWGLQFVEQNELPKPHPDVQAYEVLEADGNHVGILYLDFFPRESKRSGAWMSSYRKQNRAKGIESTPVITTVYNFTKPSGEEPALLSIDEVLTFFHEMGHALHGLLSNCTYNSLSGTSVSRDFVELPSQIMENWALQPEVLALYAKHYQTGEVIPEDLVSKIKASANFNQGFAMTEYLAASFLDMDYHTQASENELDVATFERSSLEKIGLIPEIASRYRSTYFQHVFSGGYSSGYYSYIWAEVLDSDAFEAFEEKGLFDQETALSFRENILSKGGTDDPMKLYTKFRGQEPSIEPLLKKRGLL